MTITITIAITVTITITITITTSLIAAAFLMSLSDLQLLLALLSFYLESLGLATSLLAGP